MNMEKCKYLLFCGTLALWMAGGFQQVYAATEPSSQAIQQQSNKVTGKVSDATGPIIGASVVEKGTANGTITDLDGNFSLNVKTGATLVVSYVGYKSEEVKAGRGPLNITLKEDAKALDEVVVTALGIKRERKALGYGIDEVKGEALTKAKETNLINSMAGRVPGLVVSQTAGGPSGSTRVILRGSTEMTGNNQPLYVVDGVPFDGSVNSINPDDISSMTVLKDAASAALYGSRGANGVIIITTKQGDQNTKATVKVKASLGGSNRAVRDYDRVSTDQYFELYWEALRNQYAKSADYTPATAATQASKDLVTKLMGGGPNPYGPQYAQPVGTDGKLVAGARPLWNSDWSDAMEQQALRTELNLSGTECFRRRQNQSILLLCRIPE